MPVVMPTGTCFDDTALFLDDLVARSPKEAIRERFFLVHGICYAPRGSCVDGLRDDQPYAHAWLERRDWTGRECTTVLTAGLIGGVKVWIEFDKDEYYAKHRIKDFTVYTIRRVWEENVKHETYGPWEERYVALCRNGGSKTEKVGS